MLLAGCQTGGWPADAPLAAAPGRQATAALPDTIPPWALADLLVAPDGEPAGEDATAVAEAAAVDRAERPAAVAADSETDDDATAQAEDDGPTGLEAQVEALQGPQVQPAVAARPLDLPDGQRWRGYATRLLAQGRTAMALRAFERAIAEQDADPVLLAGAGIAAMGEGQDALAERYLSAALLASPQDPAINLAKGRLLMRQGRLEPARDHFRTAFLVTSGQNELVVASLEEVDRRIAARRALYLPDLDREAAVNLSTLRTGRSSYRLSSPATGAADRAEGVLEVAAPPDAAERDTLLGEQPAAAGSAGPDEGDADEAQVSATAPAEPSRDGTVGAEDAIATETDTGSAIAAAAAKDDNDDEGNATAAP
ncbi:MAG: hypothetical protein AAF899_07915 [Pseudomonadota bacterium]